MRLTRANTKAIRHACTKFHYSKSVPSVQYAYNVYNNTNEWCGVVLFGGGANNRMPEAYGKNAGEVLELVRVALNGKQEQTSKAVALALKMLHKDDPLCKIVVSYADNRQRHVGIIYQATNWLYMGKTAMTNAQYFFNGKWTHKRTIDSRKDKEYLKKTLPKREGSYKFRYIYCFDKQERKKYKALSLPYPSEKDLTVEKEKTQPE